MPPHERGAAMMFQSYALWPHLTVERNVAFGLEERKVAKREIETRVREVLEIMRMKAMQRGGSMSSPAGSSSAWRWRGRLWSSRVACLLDEPLSNLDSRPSGRDARARSGGSARTLA